MKAAVFPSEQFISMSQLSSSLSIMSKWPPKPNNGNANGQRSVPIALLHEAEGAKVTVETKKGDLIRGLLFEAEDTMNLYIKDVVVTYPNGAVRKVPDLYVRGTEIVIIALPEILQHATVIQRIRHWRKNGRDLKTGRAVNILKDAAERRTESKRKFRARKKSTQRKFCELSVSSPSIDTPTNNEEKDWVMVSKEVPNSLVANKADDSCIIN